MNPDALRPDWQQAAPADLLAAPLTALRALSDDQARALQEALGVETVGALARHPVVDAVARAVEALAAGGAERPPALEARLGPEWRDRPPGEWAEAPLEALPDLGPEAARRLAAALHWRTVTDLATDPAVRAAREAAGAAEATAPAGAAGEAGRAPAAPASPPSGVPMPNYFGGRWQQRLHRFGTHPAGGGGEAAASAAEARRGFTLPAETDIQEGALRVSRPRAMARLEENYTPDGTYIPLHGGLRGWFRNSGVLDYEQRSGYRLHEAVDAQAFRRTILERMERFNRRGAVRVRVELWAACTLEGAAHPPASCVDLSHTGLRLRLRDAPERGQPVRLALYRHRAEVGEAAPLVEAEGVVVRHHRANPTQPSPRYYVGIAFRNLDVADKEAVSRLVDEGTPLPDAGRGRARDSGRGFAGG